MALDPRLLAVLACPEDKGPLYYLGDEEGLVNLRLARRYRIVDGIPVMLIDEAEAIAADDVAAIQRRVDAGEISPTFGGAAASAGDALG
jgi:hypothetical protein